MDRVKAAIQKELQDLEPADRVKAMRALVQFVADEYARVIIHAGREQQWKAYAKRNKKTFSYYPSLKPKPTIDEILAMSREEAIKHQRLCQIYGYQYWLIADSRFFDDGRSLKFYETFQECVKFDSESDREIKKPEYVKRSDHSYAEVENEITTEEILEYAEKVKSGQIAYEVNSHGYRSDLSPLHMRELEIDGRKWPSLEHYSEIRGPLSESAAAQHPRLFDQSKACRPLPGCATEPGWRVDGRAPRALVCDSGESDAGGTFQGNGVRKCGGVELQLAPVFRNFFASHVPTKCADVRVRPRPDKRLHARRSRSSFLLVLRKLAVQRLVGRLSVIFRNCPAHSSLENFLKLPLGAKVRFES